MKILIIEDDPMVAMIHQEFLKRICEDDELFQVKTLREAEEILKQVSIELVLLDNCLPDGTGLEFLKQLRTIPTIMITATNDATSVQTALASGVVDYLVKPFTFERFKQAVDRVNDYRQLLSYEKVSQKCLDHYLIPTYKDQQSEHLPKGLAKITLKKIVAVIVQKNHEFTTQQIADEVSISRITIKKYLNYLVEHAYLNEDAKYLTLGRPVCTYTILNHDRLKQLLD